jgi:hypothetical protein
MQRVTSDDTESFMRLRTNNDRLKKQILRKRKDDGEKGKKKTKAKKNAPFVPVLNGGLSRSRGVTKASRKIFLESPSAMADIFAKLLSPSLHKSSSSVV